MHATIYLHPEEDVKVYASRSVIADPAAIGVRIDSPDDSDGADLVLFLPPSVAVRLVEALGRVDGLTIEAMAE